MIELSIPGFKDLRLEHLVLDFNGTVAQDGLLIHGVKSRLLGLSEQLYLHVVTADTFGAVKQAISGVPCTLHILPADRQAEGKRDYVRQLGAQRTSSMGNGRNDRLMLKEAALGICVVLSEGAFSGTLLAADVVCTSILDALDLLHHPLRLTATLRS